MHLLHSIAADIIRDHNDSNPLNCHPAVLWLFIIKRWLLSHIVMVVPSLVRVLLGNFVGKLYGFQPWLLRNIHLPPFLIRYTAHPSLLQSPPGITIDPPSILPHLTPITTIYSCTRYSHRLSLFYCSTYNYYLPVNN